MGTSKTPLMFLLCLVMAGTMTFVQTVLADESGKRYIASDAMADVESATQLARHNGKRLLVVMGANWCHDSRALASQLYTQPLSDVISEHYELVFVDVGYLEKGRNVIVGFGVPAYYATPTVLIVDPVSGRLVNNENRHQWANAALIGMDESLAYFQMMAEIEPDDSQDVVPAELQKLLDEIRAFEQQQADRLFTAYAVLSPLLKAYDKGEDAGDFEATWNEVRDFRYQIPGDTAALQAEARQRVLAGETGIRLNYPVYPAFRWEDNSP